ncbi:MAG: hypothetical protein JJ863_37830 [Deltaproteobacteria bacterium]|nr:hypothetical protein [Deltaproteobacteria bacterium]
MGLDSFDPVLSQGEIGNNWRVMSHARVEHCVSIVGGQVGPPQSIHGHGAPALLDQSNDLLQSTHRLLTFPPESIPVSQSGLLLITTPSFVDEICAEWHSPLSEPRIERLLSPVDGTVMMERIDWFRPNPPPTPGSLADLTDRLMSARPLALSVYRPKWVDLEQRRPLRMYAESRGDGTTEQLMLWSLSEDDVALWFAEQPFFAPYRDREVRVAAGLEIYFFLDDG